MFFLLDSVLLHVKHTASCLKPYHFTVLESCGTEKECALCGPSVTRRIGLQCARLICLPPFSHKDPLTIALPPRSLPLHLPSYVKFPCQSLSIPVWFSWILPSPSSDTEAVSRSRQLLDGITMSFPPLPSVFSSTNLLFCAPLDFFPVFTATSPYGAFLSDERRGF